MTKPLLAVNVGVDVGKSQLDVLLLERDRALTVANDEPAIASLIRRLSRYRIERIVVEATGRLEQPFVHAALTQASPKRRRLLTHRAASRRERDRQNSEKRLFRALAAENGPKESPVGTGGNVTAVTAGK